MKNQPVQQKGLSIGKSALIGTAVAVPIALGAFYFGYSTNQPSNPPPATTAQTHTINQTTPNHVVDLKIKGNKSSRIYHLPNCPNYNDISEQNIIWFKTHEEAKGRSFRMAKNCP